MPALQTALSEVSLLNDTARTKEVYMKVKADRNQTARDDKSDSLVLKKARLPYGAMYAQIAATMSSISKLPVYDERNPSANFAGTKAEHLPEATPLKHSHIRWRQLGGHDAARFDLLAGATVYEYYFVQAYRPLILQAQGGHMRDRLLVYLRPYLRDASIVMHTDGHEYVRFWDGMFLQPSPLLSVEDNQAQQRAAELKTKLHRQAAKLLNSITSSDVAQLGDTKLIDVKVLKAVKALKKVSIYAIKSS
jgi:hypothetical protein